MAVDKNNNTAASLAFSGTLLGYVIPLSSAAINSVSIGLFCTGRHCAGDSTADLWLRKVIHAYAERKIIHHNVAAGLFMGTAALAGGIFNAACMTW